VTAADQLLLLPALTATEAEGGRFALTRKFIDGVNEYARRWPGPIRVAVRRSSQPTTNLDQIAVHPRDCPFELTWLPDRSEDLNRMMASASLAMISLVDDNIAMASVAHAQERPSIWVTEYSVKTRRQIIWTDTANPILRWRREWYNRRIEAKFREVIANAAGVQCNGTPTYEAYRPLNRNAMLYFDTRVRGEHLATPQAVATRTARLMSGQPLRLAFSGRFIPMKGADHLPLIAAELRRLNVPFRFDVCGGGPLESDMKRQVESLGMKDHFRFRGVLDFQSQLMPFIASEIDLFICPHRQGDPSCTYLETMSCGTPIAGYDNEAFTGLVRTNGVGWTAPLDQPAALAALIAKLDRSRQSLATAAAKSLEFAAQHTFEHTMQARVDHLRSCLKSSQRLVTA